MNKVPSKELLESTHTFPGPYVFKAIGPADGVFTARVIAAVREQLHSDVDPIYHSRESAGGKHVSLTLELELENAEEVIAIYLKVSKIPGLLLLL